MTADFRSRALDALSSDDPLSMLREVVRFELQRGATRDDIWARFEALRPDVTDQQEDVVLDAMDALAGWCSPHERL